MKHSQCGKFHFLSPILKFSQIFMHFHRRAPKVSLKTRAHQGAHCWITCVNRHFEFSDSHVGTHFIIFRIMPFRWIDQNGKFGNTYKAFVIKIGLLTVSVACSFWLTIFVNLKNHENLERKHGNSWKFTKRFYDYGPWLNKCYNRDKKDCSRFVQFSYTRKRKWCCAFKQYNFCR